jgi:prepilin-type N-terminal cleavage/methylation domain-containing protein
MQEGRRANRRSRGFSLIELLIVIAIILILIGIAAPMYDKLQMGARETAAKLTLKTFNIVQTQYKNTFQRYAANILELCPPASGGTSGPQAAGLLSGDICSGEKGGYVFTVTSTSPDIYSLNANPKVPGSSGRIFYFLDQTGVVRQNDASKGNEPANANSPEIR